MRYELIYNEQRKITWILIRVPLIWSAIFIGIILFITRMPEWLVLISSVLLLAVSLISVLFVIKKWLTIKCSVEITDDYFKYSMHKKSPFYSYKEIKISWEKVNNFKVEGITKSFYAVLKLSKPAMRFSLSPESYSIKHLNEFSEFTNEVELKISNYNSQAEEKHLHIISNKSIFESIGARMTAVVFILVLSALTISYKIYEPDLAINYTWWKIIWLWIISAPYLMMVFLSWKKNKG